jgi:hypothetical protein
MPAILYCYSNMGRHYIHEYLTPHEYNAYPYLNNNKVLAGMNYFDSNRTNMVILKFEAVKVINLLRNFKNGKIGN